jgi:hypothetical protein
VAWQVGRFLVYCLTVTDSEEQRARSRDLGSEAVEIRVDESDLKDLRIIYRSDVVFAIIYGLLFAWGVVLTLLAID